MSDITTFIRAAVLALLAPAYAWAAPFATQADGTVIDAATGLAWDSCYLGQHLSNARCPTTTTTPTMTWAEALMSTESLNLLRYKGHSDWRVPNIKELLSLRDLGRSLTPAIDTEAFPDTVPALYWTSTSLASYPSSAWMVQFSFGDTVFSPKSDLNYVRLVRGGSAPTAFDAMDDSAPQTTAGPTVVTPGTSGASATVSVAVNEDATGFWLVVPAGQPAPTPAALATGRGMPIGMAAGVAAGFSISGLTAGSTYVLYFAARDGSGNLQPSVMATVFTVAASPSPALTAVPATSVSGLLLLSVLLAGCVWCRRRLHV